MHCWIIGECWAGGHYLKVGLGEDCAGQVRARELAELPKICSMATEENFGTELPIGSDGKTYG